MKRLFFGAMVLAALYAGYWVVGSRTVEGQAVSGLEALQNDGWAVAYSDVRTRGFPSRFDTTVTDLDLTAPDGSRYQAPFVQALALSYRPNEVIAAFPNEQTLTIAGTEIALRSDRLRASGSVGVSTDLPFREATLEGEAVAATLAGTETTVLIDSLLAAVRRADGDDPAYDAFADLRDIALPAPAGTLPGPVDRIMLDAQVLFDRELDRENMAEPVPPLVTDITVNDALVVWDTMQIKATGALFVDVSGYLEGEIELRLRAWEQMLQLAADSGLIAPGVLQTYQSMASGLAQGSDELVLPLTLSDGAVRMGFVPLGPAPRLR
ncbi:MAG: DUF2125 domain-containing protein [Paracoccaceae bacterium]